MDVFRLRNQVVGEYSEYVRSFIHIREPRIRGKVDEELGSGLLWPDPLIQLNSVFEPGSPQDLSIHESSLVIMAVAWE